MRDWWVEFSVICTYASTVFVYGYLVVTSRQLDVAMRGFKWQRCDLSEV